MHVTGLWVPAMPNLTPEAFGLRHEPGAALAGANAKSKS
jgi:hypothetical protein